MSRERRGGGGGNAAVRLSIVAFVVVIGILIFTSPGHHEDVTEHALAQVRRELEEERRKNKAHHSEAAAPGHVTDDSTTKKPQSPKKHGSSDSFHDDEEVDKPSSAKNREHGHHDDKGDHEDADEPPTPPRKGKRRGDTHDDDHSDGHHDDDDEVGGHEDHQQTKKKKKKPAADDHHDDDHDDEGDDESATTKAPRAKKKRTPRPPPDFDGEVDDEADTKPKKKSKQRRAAAEAASHHEEQEEDDDNNKKSDADGDGPLAVPKGAKESNVMPEDIHTPEERKFRHYVLPIAELPDDAPPEAAQVREALMKYAEDPEDQSVIPVYGTACIGEVDCLYVKNQLKSLDTGVGHIVVVMNKEYPEYHEYFHHMQRLFPGRFTFQYRPQGGGCAESWNIMMRLGFSIRPTPKFVMATNGDLWALPGYLARFAKYMNDNLERQVAARFVHFSSYGLNRRGWETLGPFDEVIYPAYAEDVEYHIRAVSAGVDIGSFPGMKPDRSHKHAGSRSFADKSFMAKYQRWDKNDYMYRKWGVDMRMHTDFARCKPFKTPWNQPTLTHRNSWVVDPVHRECIKTGNGPKHKAKRSGCMLSSCNSCWYNASVLLKLLPEGTVLPDSIMTQNRVRF